MWTNWAVIETLNHFEYRFGYRKVRSTGHKQKMEEMVADLESPEPGKWDKGHTAAKIILAGIPYIGGSAAELFSAVIAPPLEKRRKQWLDDIVERLKLLEQESNEFRIESLSQNDAFITITMHAT